MRKQDLVVKDWIVFFGVMHGPKRQDRVSGLAGQKQTHSLNHLVSTARSSCAQDTRMLSFLLNPGASSSQPRR